MGLNWIREIYLSVMVTSLWLMSNMVLRAGGVAQVVKSLTNMMLDA
jgi:hypothetical protein